MSLVSTEFHSSFNFSGTDLWILFVDATTASLAQMFRTKISNREIYLEFVFGCQHLKTSNHTRKHLLFFDTSKLHAHTHTYKYTIYAKSYVVSALKICELLGYWNSSKKKCLSVCFHENQIRLKCFVIIFLCVCVCSYINRKHTHRKIKLYIKDNIIA